MVILNKLVVVVVVVVVTKTLETPKNTTAKQSASDHIKSRAIISEINRDNKKCH